MEIVKMGKIKLLTSPLIKARHGFTLRDGGVSEGEYASLNVGLRRGDDPFNAFENIKICAEAMGLDKKRLTLTYQLHTDNVRIVGEEDLGKGLIREWGEGVDAIVTSCADTPLMCYSADCVPVLLCDGENGVVGAVHSGWRGTAKNILKNACEKMEELGAQKKSICAFIGPAIGMCCYEVSSDVAEAFSDFPDCMRKKENDKYMLDLKAIVKKQLMLAGVLSENIDVAEMCTCCDNDNFFSHRKQKGKSGLLGGFIQYGAKD